MIDYTSARDMRAQYIRIDLASMYAYVRVH